MALCPVSVILRLSPHQEGFWIVDVTGWPSTGASPYPPFLNDRAAAERGVTEFVNRFRVQGYSVGVDGRLAVEEIAGRCTIECSAR